MKKYTKFLEYCLILLPALPSAPFRSLRDEIRIFLLPLLFINCYLLFVLLQPNNPRISKNLKTIFVDKGIIFQAAAAMHRVVQAGLYRILVSGTDVTSLDKKKRASIFLIYRRSAFFEKNAAGTAL